MDRKSERTPETYIKRPDSPFDLLALPLKHLGIINKPDGSFTIPNIALYMKDFLGGRYEAPSTSPLASKSGCIILTNTIHAYQSSLFKLPGAIRPTISNIPEDEHLLPHPVSQTTLPLWRQTPSVNDALVTWPPTQKFLRDFCPAIEAAGAIFHHFQPAEYLKMQKRHGDLVRRKLKAGEKAGLLKPVWDDEFLTPFASMRVFVTGNREIASGSVREGMMEIQGGRGFESTWSVVLFLGAWIGGRALFGVEGDESGMHYVEVESGDAWVLKGSGGKAGGKGCVFGMEGGSIVGGSVIGERVVVQFFVPEEGWNGIVEKRRSDRIKRESSV